ncbi:MAG: VWA domain-containing protein [Pirellulaceae bacterium]
MSHPALIGQASTQVVHYFARLHTLTEWWQWFMLLAVTIAVAVYVITVYRRDSVELPRGLAASLLLLRLVALGGILFFFLDLEKREERRLVRNSRAAVLVDTSLSMGVRDSGPDGSRQRIEDVIHGFGQDQLLGDLRKQHDVVVYRFDQQATPVEIVSLSRTTSPAAADSSGSGAPLADATRDARHIALLGGVLLALAIILLCVHWLRGSGKTGVTSPAPGGELPEGEAPDGSWLLLGGMVAGVAGLIVLGVASLRHPDLPLAVVAGLAEPAPAVSGPSRPLDAPEPDKSVAWTDALAPRGTETRLGDALKFVINQERGGPIAGIVVLTDGGSNAGSDYQESVVTARAAGIPVHVVGLGSDRRPTNIRVVDLEAPPRVFPGDKFQLKGFVQSFGLVGRAVKVQLMSTAGPKPGTGETVEQEQQIRLPPDGELLALELEVTPEEIGARTFTLRVVPPTQDADPLDNEKSAKVQVVERKNRVLLLAGGPLREFQFVRNMLFRDRSTTLDVLLQSGAPGISQEANQLLFDFPSSAEQLFEYDCIVAFDPDWTLLDEQQIELLERWVAEKAGGLILVAGPVETPKLMGGGADSRKLETVRGLYPVSFYSRGSATISLSRTSSETPWPLAFTREGEEAEFLRLADDLAESRDIWTAYPGIYGYFAVKGLKQGATALAHFSDPATMMDGSRPIYMAYQFYGAGRVYYQGSGEMWWLRQVDDAHFERFYTQLIRWVSQGRLLRDSSRGVLLVDKDRCYLGETVTAQAVLSNAQFEPLLDPEVPAILVHPDGRRSNLPLKRVDDAARAGAYSVQFTATLEGDYRIEVPLPGATLEETLAREVRARMPTLETEQPERNDPLLKDLTQKTGGHYYVGFGAAVNRATASLTPLALQVEPQDQVTFLPGTPDRHFDQVLMTWLMAIICGALSVEWLIRRLVRLA